VASGWWRVAQAFLPVAKDEARCAYGTGKSGRATAIEAASLPRHLAAKSRNSEMAA
jgi:hypothetical protein